MASGDFNAIEVSVGYSVKDIIARPPIAMLMVPDESKEQLTPELREQYKQQARNLIEMFLARQINSLNKMVNSANGVQPWQIPIIAGQLIQMYPTESLEDFVLCFRRGSTGFYGPIYNRLDFSVLTEWMKNYLDEKYQLVEAKVVESRSAEPTQPVINYAEFAKRAPQFIKPEKPKTDAEVEYLKRRAMNPYKWFKVEGVEIYATSQKHAEELAERAIKAGELTRTKK